MCKKKLPINERRKLLPIDRDAEFKTILQVLSKLDSEGKMSWFEENYKSFYCNYSYSYPLEFDSETFLCWRIAILKHDNKFTSREDAIEMIIEDCETDLRNHKSMNSKISLTSLEVVKIKRHLKYFQGLVVANELPSNGIISKFQNLSWDNKTDLCELIYCLWKSNRILDNGKPIKQNKLISFFEFAFNDNVDYHGLITPGMTSNKKTMDNNFFCGELLKYAKSYTPKKSKLK